MMKSQRIEDVKDVKEDVKEQALMKLLDKMKELIIIQSLKYKASKNQCYHLV